jgi:hypothetical protein
MDRSHLRYIEGNRKNAITVFICELCKLILTACRCDYRVACFESCGNERARPKPRGETVMNQI